jgi:hypothetical protein
LLLRLAPAIGAALVVLGLVVPAYFRFEPHESGERAGAGLILLVALTGGLVLAGCYRAVASWLATRRVEQTWRRVAERAAWPGLNMPAYRVPSELPFAAIAGYIHPRLYVSDSFFDALSDEERRAVVGHEAGHLRSLDNLKRLAIRLAPDWLSWTSTGREIEAAWAIAAEEAADDHAARPDEAARLAVASALIKASRFAPARLAPVSNFCDGTTIARRVARLLEEAPADRGEDHSIVLARVASLAALLGAAALFAGSALPATYAAAEAIVRQLQ